MTTRRAHRIAHTFYSICRDPHHPNQHRNALNQTARAHRIPERKVHTALLITR